jgi:adenylate kinase
MIIVLGVPGVGKSTVLNKVKVCCHDWEIVNWGDVMFAEAKKKFGIKHRDEIRKLRVEEQKTLQKHAALAIKEKDKELHGKVIVDTHCSIFTPSGYLPGLPYEILKLLHPSHLILLTAKPEEILVRRLKDKGRIREPNIEQIREHLRMNEMFLATYATLSSSPCIVVHNSDGGLDRAVKQIVDVLNRVVCDWNG